MIKKCFVSIMAVWLIVFSGYGARAENSHTFTVNADFDTGYLINVNHDVPGADQLQLNVKTKTFPFINVAASGRGTVVRINTQTGEVIGEYRTAPEGLGNWVDMGGPWGFTPNPSRTTVDLYGNVWVGNRADDVDGMGSVVKIGLIIGGTRCRQDGTPDPDGEYLKPPFEYNTCVDRNGDGLIKTSRRLSDIRPWTNAGSADRNGGVSTADDEAILI